MNKHVYIAQNFSPLNRCRFGSQNIPRIYLNSWESITLHGRGNRHRVSCTYFLVIIVTCTSVVQQPTSGLGLFTLKVPTLRIIKRTHTQTRKYFSGWVNSPSQKPLPTQHTTNTGQRHIFLQWDSNSWSQQSRGRRPVSLTARSPRSA